MLQVRQSSAASDQGMAREPSLHDALSSLARIVRRQIPVFVLITSISVLLGIAYLLTTPPSYTAVATMVIDTRKMQLFQQQSVLGEIPADAGSVGTQVEILNSENISLAVIKELRLTEDSEFAGSGISAFGTLLGFFAPSQFAAPKSDFEASRRALARFEQARSIRRVGQTFAIEIRFRSLSPDKAAKIANAIAEAYIVDQLEAKYQATRRASSWLQDRITELRSQASAAERAVIDYKRQNNIVDSGGRLMNEQQLAELNTQLVVVRATSAEAKARLDRINDILKQDVPNESVADALKNETIIKLRGQYVDLANKEATLSEKYGQNHMAAVNLRNQMQEIRRNVSQELQRIQQAYQSDSDIARAREESIRNSLAKAVTDTQLTHQAQVQLRELESNAQSYRSMHDNFLQRYMEAVQQQSFPITEARLITPAARPIGKSHPKGDFIIAISLAIGLLLSTGVAFLRDMSDGTFRTDAQVEEILHTSCIAVLPLLETTKGRIERTSIAPDGPALPATTDGMLWHVVEHPFSRFSEAIRAIKVTADLNSVLKSNKVIGITSTLPGEGKSTIASNLAQLIAHAGARVLLVDADLRNSSLSRSLAREGCRGLIDVVVDKAPLNDALIYNRATHLMFLPAGGTPKLPHTNEILASVAMKKLIDDLRATVDYIIVDLPPLVPVVDVRTTTGFIDSYVFVVEWGQTKVEIAKRGLFGARAIHDRLVGVVLNKTDTAVLDRYSQYAASYYHAT